jgi:hypothetical protein
MSHNPLYIDYYFNKKITTINYFARHEFEKKNNFIIISLATCVFAPIFSNRKIISEKRKCTLYNLFRRKIKSKRQIIKNKCPLSLWKQTTFVNL